MKKLIDLFASAWVLLVVIYPFVAIISMAIAMGVFGIGLLGAVGVAVAVFILCVILLVTGVFRAEVTGIEFND